MTVTVKVTRDSVLHRNIVFETKFRFHRRQIQADIAAWM